MVLLTTCSAQITSVALLGDIALETSEQQTLEFVFAAKDGTAQEAIDEAAQNLTLAWESVAKVDETGCVTAVALREAGIIVISGKELAANCRVAAAGLPTGAEAPPESLCRAKAANCT